MRSLLTQILDIDILFCLGYARGSYTIIVLFPLQDFRLPNWQPRLAVLI